MTNAEKLASNLVPLTTMMTSLMPAKSPIPANLPDQISSQHGESGLLWSLAIAILIIGAGINCFLIFLVPKNSSELFRESEENEIIDISFVETKIEATLEEDKVLSIDGSRNGVVSQFNLFPLASLAQEEGFSIEIEELSGYVKTRSLSTKLQPIGIILSS